jgi:[ribosomal protein S5]-alanine N-acetyltransferase
MQLQTHRFILKEIENTDIENIHKGLSNPELTKYYDVHFPTLEATKEQMDWYADLKQNGTGIWWGIYSKETQEFCGAGGYNSLVRTHKKAEIGLWLLPEFWGKGIMTEVMPLLFKIGFEQLDLNRIEGIVQSENSKCKQALAKINFTHEGCMRQWELKEGNFIDVDLYAILKQDWKNNK